MEQNMAENETDTQTATTTADATQTTATEPNNPTTGDATQTTAANVTQTTTAETTTQTTEPDKTKEPELKIEDYGDLGLVEEEGVKLDANLQKSFKELCLENKIPVETAKKVAKLQYDAIKKQHDDFVAMQKSWEEENTKTYGENLKNVKTNAGRVLAELDKSGKFKEFLELAGAANAPATLGFLKEVGDRVLEKSSVNPSATTTPTMKELEDFYKN